MRKKEIPPFATTWLKLDGVKLSEIRQRKINTVLCPLYVNFKKLNS